MKIRCGLAWDKSHFQALLLTVRLRYKLLKATVGYNAYTEEQQKFENDKEEKTQEEDGPHERPCDDPGQGCGSAYTEKGCYLLPIFQLDIQSVDTAHEGVWACSYV